MSSPISMAVMFLPISSTPPRGIMRITPGATAGMLSLTRLTSRSIDTGGAFGLRCAPNFEY